MTTTNYLTIYVYLYVHGVPLTMVSRSQTLSHLRESGSARLSIDYPVQTKIPHNGNFWRDLNLAKWPKIYRIFGHFVRYFCPAAFA